MKSSATKPVLPLILTPSIAHASAPANQTQRRFTAFRMLNHSSRVTGFIPLANNFSRTSYVRLNFVGVLVYWKSDTFIHNNLHTPSTHSNYSYRIAQTLHAACFFLKLCILNQFKRVVDAPGKRTLKIPSPWKNSLHASCTFSRYPRLQRRNLRVLTALWYRSLARRSASC